MNTNLHEENNEFYTLIPAKNPDPAEISAAEPSPTPSDASDPRDAVPTVQDRLRPVHPDPDLGFQPLSEFLVNRITREVMKRMRECPAPLDLNYWERYTRTILGQTSPNDTLIVSSPAGSGKSTWIKAFIPTLAQMIRDDPQLAESLVGVVVVLQKVDDLNELAAVVNEDAPKDDPSMVALQGWSQSSQKLGFCLNHDVSCFDECKHASCPFAADCELLTFWKRSLSAPVVGLTQRRFDMLRSSGDLDLILHRIGPDSLLHPRRYLIFDEKFQMAQVDTLDKNCIDNASRELTKLISSIGATDSRIRRLQQSLSCTIERTFQAARQSQCLSTDRGNFDIQAGFCSLQPDGAARQSYQSFRDSVMSGQRRYATPSLRTAFSVMDELHAGNACLFSKTNGFAVSKIIPAQLHYGECQTIIFDATAAVDEDYSHLEHVQFLSGKPERKACQVEFYIFQHKDLNVSRRAMKECSWKIQAFSRLIAELEGNSKENIFLCTYKDYAEAFADALKAEMPPGSFQHILLMPNREAPAVPYFGGTNGSNRFHSATCVFMVGYPRLDPQSYLINACAAYGQDKIAAELSAVPPLDLVSKNAGVVFSLPSVRSYMAHHLAARLEQEIYRCALRSPSFHGRIKIYLFCPANDMLEILLKRIPGIAQYYSGLPSCIEVCKGAARSYEGGETSFRRLSSFLKGWNGTPIRTNELRERLNISKSVWKDLIADPRFKSLAQQYGIQCRGRGRNTVWYIPTADCA